MNARYRKAMRLKSRHRRRGHTPWCQCLEMRQALAIGLGRLFASGQPLAHRTVISPPIVERKDPDRVR